MKITFPHLGNTYICVKAMLDDLSLDYIIPPFNNKQALELGTKYAPELACLPLKINIGNYIQACDQGADTILMAGGCGPCRFGYYCEVQREILKDLGYKMEIITLELPKGGIVELYGRVRRLIGNASLLCLIKAVFNTVYIAKKVDELEALTFRIRPREIIKGSTDRIYKEFKQRAFDEKGSSNIKKLIKDTRNRLLKIEINADLKPFRVGMVGEIYTGIEHFASFEIQERLGGMGVEVDRKVTVSNWIIEHMIKNALHLPRDMRYAAAAKPYLGKMIGGHAQETVGHTVLYARDGFDGVIQVFPLSCMPEIVAESVLPAVERDTGIPVLKLIIDEMTGEAGYMTRLEAFVDLLKKRRESAEIEDGQLLPGN